MKTSEVVGAHVDILLALRIVIACAPIFRNYPAFQGFYSLEKKKAFLSWFWEKMYKSRNSRIRVLIVRWKSPEFLWPRAKKKFEDQLLRWGKIILRVYSSSIFMEPYYDLTNIFHTSDTNKMHWVKSTEQMLVKAWLFSYDGFFRVRYSGGGKNRTKMRAPASILAPQFINKTGMPCPQSYHWLSIRYDRKFVYLVVAKKAFLMFPKLSMKIYR